MSFCVDEPFRESGFFKGFVFLLSRSPFRVFFYEIFFLQQQQRNHDFVGPIWMHSSCYTFWVLLWRKKKNGKEKKKKVKPNQNRESSSKCKIRCEVKMWTMRERIWKISLYECSLSDLCWFHFCSYINRLFWQKMKTYKFSVFFSTTLLIPCWLMNVFFFVC